MDVEKYAFAEIAKATGRMRVLTILRAELLLEFRLWEADDDGKYTESLSLATDESPDRHLCCTISIVDAVMLESREGIEPVRKVAAAAMAFFAANLPDEIAEFDKMITAQSIALRGMFLGETKSKLLCDPEEFTSPNFEELLGSEGKD